RAPVCFTEPSPLTILYLSAPPCGSRSLPGTAPRGWSQPEDSWVLCACGGARFDQLFILCMISYIKYNGVISPARFKRQMQPSPTVTLARRGRGDGDRGLRWGHRAGTGFQGSASG